MPERNHEVIIDGFVFPDTVTVTLANDEYINSRDYVSKELYESICAANDAWQEQNSKLRELVQILVHCLNDVDCDKCPLNGNPYELRGEWAACDALRDLLDELKECE